jgi:hypothetical protein
MLKLVLKFQRIYRILHITSMLTDSHDYFGQKVNSDLKTTHTAAFRKLNNRDNAVKNHFYYDNICFT